MLGLKELNTKYTQLEGEFKSLNNNYNKMKISRNEYDNMKNEYSSNRVNNEKIINDLKNENLMLNQQINKSNNGVYKFFHNKIGVFWSTVILVEIMDMAFSIDNVFAAVAFSKNIILVCVGVFIGILAMRFIAQWFVKLMEKYNFLETAAFVVISILGIKLLLSIYEHFYSETELSIFLGSHAADITISILTVTIFFIPILTSMLFNFPKKQIEKD